METANRFLAFVPLDRLNTHVSQGLHEERELDPLFRAAIADLRLTGAEEETERARLERSMAAALRSAELKRVQTVKTDLERQMSKMPGTLELRRIYEQLWLTADRSEKKIRIASRVRAELTEARDELATNPSAYMEHAKSAIEGLDARIQALDKKSSQPLNWDEYFASTPPEKYKTRDMFKLDNKFIYEMQKLG